MRCRCPKSRRRCERFGCHYSRGCLARGSRNRDELAARHRCAKRFRTSSDRNAELSRSSKFRMILRNGRCDDDFLRAVDVRRIVTVLHVNAEPLEICGDIRRSVAAGDREPSANEKLGQRAHACAGDSNKMNGTTIGHWCE